MGQLMKKTRKADVCVVGGGLAGTFAAIAAARHGAKVVLIEKQAPKALIDALEAEGFAVAKIDILSTCRETDGSDGYFEAQRANARAVANACRQVSE